jgi:hypothetical protein
MLLVTRKFKNDGNHFPRIITQMLRIKLDLLDAQLVVDSLIIIIITLGHSAN